MSESSRDWTKIWRGGIESAVNQLKEDGMHGLAQEVENLLTQHDRLCVGLQSIINQAKATLPPPTVHELEQILADEGGGESNE